MSKTTLPPDQLRLSSTGGLYDNSGLALRLAASSGLEFVASGNGLLRIAIRGAPNYSGLNRDSGGMYIQTISNSGLQIGSSGIGVQLDGSTGLQLGSGGLSLENPVEIGSSSMTFTAGTNTTAGSGSGTYLRVGDMVVVFGILSITASGAGNSTFEMTYPFSRTGSANSGACSGNGVNAAATLLLAITGSGTAAQRWAGRFQSTGAGTYGMTCNFVYRLS